MSQDDFINEALSYQMKGDIFFLVFGDIFQGKTKKVTLISKPGMCQDDKQMHIFRGKHAV